MSGKLWCAKPGYVLKKVLSSGHARAGKACFIVIHCHVICGNQVLMRITFRASVIGIPCILCGDSSRSSGFATEVVSAVA